MFTTLKRAFLAVAFVGLSLAVAVPAVADTNSFAWTDLSAQLTSTTNRPVWASAYASGNWFYTDGQNLWNGGQVYRYDGATQVNITTDVRNAGLSHVDDIVSDGQSVLFLQDMSARNNQFTAVEYTNGAYTYVGSALRNAFNSDEGIGNIVGRNGDWYITTSKGRVLHWLGNTSTPTQVTLPSNLQVNVNNAYQDFVADSFSGGFTYKNDEFRVLPISGNEWLYVFGANFYQWSTPYAVTPQMFRSTNGSFTDISSNLVGRPEFNAFSNGSSAIILEGDHDGGTSNYLIVDGANVHSYSSNVFLFGSAIWTGQSWMIVGGGNKHVLRVVDGLSEDLGESRDYFVTGASNNSGTVLLGGAVSVLGNSQPTNPLTAKLVKVVDNGTTNNSNTNINTTNNQQTQNGISFWSWNDPNQSNIARNQFLTFYVGSWSQKGINSVQIYVNGSVKQTCNLNNATGNQQCSASLYGGDYALGTNVAVNAKITDGSGAVVWTTLQNLNVVDVNGNTSNNTPTDVSAWTTIDPTGSILNRTASATFHVNATASNGLSRIDVYANGSIIRTCNFSQAYGTQTCDTTVYGSNYGAGTQLSLNAKATAWDGSTAWSDTRAMTVQDTNSNGTTNTNSNGSTWVWSTPETSTLNAGQNAVFSVGANDPNGISRIDMYVNGTIANTCNLGNAFGNQQCSVTVNANSYAIGTNVFVNAKVTDANGNTMWSDSRNYNIATTNGSTNTGTNTNTNANGSTWIWSVPETSTLTSGQSATFNVGANDPDGISKIEVLVNGSTWNTCNLGNAFGNQQCQATVNASSFAANTNVFVNARMTDAFGNVTWSASRTYMVSGTTQTNTNTNTNTTNATAPATWIWAAPDKSEYTGADTATFSVGTWSQNGISKIEIYANGAVVQTCTLGAAYGNQQCSYNVNSTKNGTTSIYVNAKVTDTQGIVSWSNAKTFTFVNVSNGSTGLPTDLPGLIKVSSNHDSGYRSTDKITYTATASDKNGVSRIDLLVDGILVKTCTNTSTCSFTGGSYDDRTSVSYGAKLTDKNGFALWTGYKNIYKK